jgi:glucose-6-phosphate 1-dehydrogenase
VYQSILPLTKKTLSNQLVLGQYTKGKVEGKNVKGYLQEKNVAGESNVPTFVATRFFIENWRWSGVPFYIRSGKRLPRRVTEIDIQFKQPPLKLLEDACKETPNTVIIRVQPNEEISVLINVKQPGIYNVPHVVNMHFNYAETYQTESFPPYGRLLLDCIKGDLTLFARQDGIEAMWEVVDPINVYWESQSGKDILQYPAGTWGPEAAKELIRRDGRNWRF